MTASRCPEGHACIACGISSMVRVVVDRMAPLANTIAAARRAQYICGGYAPSALAFAGSVDIPPMYPSPNEAHYTTCLSLRKPSADYELGNPDSEQHCRTCHCSCDPEGPTCGHTAGCPGC